VLATVSQPWPILVFAAAPSALVAFAGYAVYRAVRRHEWLVRVLAATAMMVLTAVGLVCALVIGGFGVLTALCPRDAFECPA